MKKILLTLISLACFSASAGPIIEVLTGGNVPGYGASGFHDASGANPMSGPSVAFIYTATGTYNSNGDLNAELSWDNAISGSFAGILSGNLDFSAAAGSSMGTLELVLNGLGGSFIFDVTAGTVCCSGPFAPNSYTPDPGTGTSILTLWTAEVLDFRSGISPILGIPRLGMDLQLRIAQVPEPGTTLLLGTGLALLGLRLARKNRAAS